MITKKDFEEMSNRDVIEDRYQLMEMSGHDIDVMCMEEMNDLSLNPLAIARYIFYGGRFGGGEFNPNDEFFCYDGRGNFESIPQSELKEWFEDNGIEDYLEDYEEEYDEEEEEEE